MAGKIPLLLHVEFCFSIANIRFNLIPVIQSTVLLDERKI